MSELLKKAKKKLINHETILYTFFGVITSVLNVVLFKMLLMAKLKYKVANIITLVIVKVTAYICNKNFVFRSHCENFFEFLKEIFRFIIARGATLLIDYFGLIFMVEVLQLSKVPSKIFITVFVIIINYWVGKAHVFKKTISQTK